MIFSSGRWKRYADADAYADAETNAFGALNSLAYNCLGASQKTQKCFIIDAFLIERTAFPVVQLQLRWNNFCSYSRSFKRRGV